MTVETFFGCAFLAYGLPLALFALTIAKDPVRIIVLILSSFFWLLSLLCSAILWNVVVPLKEEIAFGLCFSVFFQELFRLFIYLLLKKADLYLRRLTESEPTQIFLNPHLLAYTVGLGFGLMSGAFSLMNVLADALGPGTVGLAGQPQDFFLVSSCMTLCMILLHTCWGVIFFSSMDNGQYYLSLYVFISHMLVSCLTLLNKRYLYVASVLPAYIVLALTGVLAARQAGVTIASIKKAIKGGSDVLAVPVQDPVQ
ncbi:gamma-secretase subunit Aph-1 isoform X2 [Eurytemora carolleeae]|nr:gamma-secretase subunit Aph-1 isoform X2 [Eurytemora carolleeae]|eukprot:XP_023339759.1 gamma-secretase subunit Aph-1-like isoform X2 [Eurytemora affinis]